MSARAQELSRQREPDQRELSWGFQSRRQRLAWTRKTAFLSQPGLNTCRLTSEAFHRLSEELYV
jgi:hypothetical protein